jgi:hypothetical protein
MTTAAPSPTGRLTNTLEEMRVVMAAEGTRKGLAGTLQAAILSLLELLVALLAEFRAGTLAAAPGCRAETGAPGATCAAGVPAAGAGGRGCFDFREPAAVLSADQSGDGRAVRGDSPAGGAAAAAARLDPGGAAAAGVAAAAAADAEGAADAGSGATASGPRPRIAWPRSFAGVTSLVLPLGLSTAHAMPGGAVLGADSKIGAESGKDTCGLFVAI